MPRSLVWILYAGCVLVWSSTWVVIAVGLDGVAPFLGAGIRFALAGLGVLLAARLTGRSLGTDWRLSAIVGVLPFATTYGLIYWAEQYVPSGLTAVLFGVLPLYMRCWPPRCCPTSRCGGGCWPAWRWPSAGWRSRSGRACTSAASTRRSPRSR